MRKSRVKSASADQFRRATKAELAKLGLSKKSARYVPKDVSRVSKATVTISARQFQQKKLSEQYGEKVTLEKRGRKIREGDARTAAAVERSERARNTPRAKYKRAFAAKKGGGYLSDEDFGASLDYLRDLNDPEEWTKFKALWQTLRTKRRRPK